MKTGNLLKRWTMAMLAMVLTIVLFAIPAFADTTAAETTAEEVTTEAATEAATEAVTTAGTTSDKKDDESKGLTTGTIVGLIITGVIVVVLVVLGIKFREKVKKFLRVYRSESKKIVWLPWDQTRKSTLVVLVVLVACALAICLLDFGLSKGYLAFINLLTK